MVNYNLSDEEKVKVEKCFSCIPICGIFICDEYPNNLEGLECESFIKSLYLQHCWSDEGGCFIPGEKECIIILKDKRSLYHELSHVYNYRLICDAFCVNSKYELKEEDKLFYTYISEFLAEYYSCIINGVDVKDYMIMKNYKPLKYRLGMMCYMLHKYPDKSYGNLNDVYRLFISSFRFSLDKIEIVDKNSFNDFLFKLSLRR